MDGWLETYGTVNFHDIFFLNTKKDNFQSCEKKCYKLGSFELKYKGILTLSTTIKLSISDVKSQRKITSQILQFTIFLLQVNEKNYYQQI